MCLSAIARDNEMPFSEEASIVAAARAGDAGAFGILAANYQRKILNTVRRITGNLEDAEDVTQQALMKAFLSVCSFRGMCSFSSWLTRIAINEALMLRRKPHTRCEVGWPCSASFEEDAVVPEIADVRPNPEQCYDKRERHQLVKMALKALKPKSRLAIEICDLNGISLKEFALRQGTTVAAAKSCLFRSRNLLRAKVNRFLRTRAGERLRAF